jgi:hypothetical protein
MGVSMPRRDEEDMPRNPEVGCPLGSLKDDVDAVRQTIKMQDGPVAGVPLSPQ